MRQTANDSSLIHGVVAGINLHVIDWLVLVARRYYTRVSIHGVNIRYWHRSGVKGIMSESIWRLIIDIGINRLYKISKWSRIIKNNAFVNVYQRIVIVTVSPFDCWSNVKLAISPHNRIILHWRLENVSLLHKLIFTSRCWQLRLLVWLAWHLPHWRKWRIHKICCGRVLEWFWHLESYRND